jgi:hypothetical protein
MLIIEIALGIVLGFFLLAYGMTILLVVFDVITIVFAAILWPFHVVADRWQKMAAWQRWAWVLGIAGVFVIIWTTGPKAG